MRYLIGLPICLVMISGATWLIANRYCQVVAREDGSVGFADRVSPAEQALAITQAQPSGKPEEAMSAFDSIAVNGCTLLPIQEHSVASQIDGQLKEIHVSLGTRVDAGHCLAQLDDVKLRLQVELLEIKANSDSSEKIARAMFEEADAKVAYARKANSSGLTSVPELELKTYLAERDRYASEIKKATEDREEARKELEKAKVLLEMHRIQSALKGEVVKVFKKPGETVKQGETLFRIARTDRLLIEGFCKAQDAGLLRPGQPVLAEADLQGPQVAQLIGHTATVNHLAIAPEGKLLASASDDGSVILWSWPGGVRLATLSHPDAVHAVEMIRLADQSSLRRDEPGGGGAGDSPARYLLVTGCEDRVVRVWNCSAEGKVEGPVFELRGHEGAIESVAISPDGKYCASGGEDRRIGLWDLAQGQHIGWVCSLGAWKNSAHQGSVTGIQFAGADILVSTGTDNLHKVWKIDEGQNQLLKAHQGRSGDVSRPGLGGDGRQILLDHGDELRILDRDSGTVQGVLHNTSHVRFEGFARFSPSNQLLVTASADGRLQLWRTPVEPKTRAALYQKFKNDVQELPHLGGFTIRTFQLPRAVQARCGIFAPDESVFFTGGTGATIRVWAIPPKTEWEPRTARLTYVGSEVEPGTDLVRIQAEMDNPAERSRWWLPGTFVNLKVFP